MKMVTTRILPVAMGALLLLAGHPALGAGAKAPAKKRVLAFIPGEMANESQAFAAKMFKKHAAEFGFEIVVFDGKGDAQIQAQAVASAVAQKVDVICTNPNDAYAIIPSLQAARKAGVLVGMFMADVPKGTEGARDFFVGIDDVQAGEAAAKAFLAKFPNGTSIVEIGGQSGADPQIRRHDGFNNAIKGTKIKVIDYKACQQWNSEQAMAIAEDMLTKHGDKIEGVFCHWDNGATGIIEALKARKRTGVFIVGVDGNRAGFDQVRSGAQFASIAQNVETEAAESMKVAKKLLQGEKVNPIDFIPLDIVTKDNINSFTTPEW
jgi:ribose transport system substrate-binding protein